MSTEKFTSFGGLTIDTFTSNPTETDSDFEAREKEIEAFMAAVEDFAKSYPLPKGWVIEVKE